MTLIMSERDPVTTLAELDGLDSDEMVEGYVDGFKGEPEPGDNRSKSYWHGWRNGNSDHEHKSDAAQRMLARLIVSRAARQEGDPMGAKRVSQAKWRAKQK